jgi:hypothetical protein
VALIWHAFRPGAADEAAAQEGFAQLKVALPTSLTSGHDQQSWRGRTTLDSVVIGVDPHKHSVTIEVVDDCERVLHKGRYGTDPDGYRQMLAAVVRAHQQSPDPNLS